LVHTPILRGIATVFLLAACTAATPGAHAQISQPAATSPDTDQPLWRATHGVLLAAARAGSRLVVVGDRGTILLSDDQGATWRLAPSGTQALLTAVLFTSATDGWVVGQDSTILHTQDGGLHWTSQPRADGNDQALFSVVSLGAGHMVATGAYALMVETTDGVAWTPVKLPNLDEDYHLNCAMARGQDLIVTGEAGHAFIRHAGTWAPAPVPYEGSQFGCLSRPDGTIYSFGLRGSLFVSTTAAPAWKRIETHEARPFFGGTVLANGFIALVGGNGLMMILDPQTSQLRTLPPVTAATLSGVVEAGSGKWIVVGDDGIHLVDPAAAITPAAEVTQ
jgi:photosystem II stability/assembly factor-like uncharacterized protein